MELNYHKFFKSFWEKRLVCPLTSCEVDMYLYLLKECGLGNWANTFKLPTKKCELELDFTRKTISSVRNSLQQKGLIKFTPSKKRGETAEYEIVGLSVFLEETQMETQMETQTKETEREKEKVPPTPPIKEKDKEKERCLNRRLKPDGFALTPMPAETSTRAKKEPTVCHKGRLIFETFYENLYGEAYYWQAKDAKAMNSILKKITFSRKNRAVPLPVDEASILSAWQELLGMIDKSWIMNNFSVNKIDSQYNEIISEIKNKNKEHGDKRVGWKAPQYDTEEKLQSGFKRATGK